MFIDFFFTLRRHKLPVSVTEWMTLMEALDGGHISNLEEFYYLARAILIKSEAHFDGYDLAFQEYFGGVVGYVQIPDKILEWTRDALERRNLRPDELPPFEKMTIEELLRELEKRIKEQKEKHDGGNYWIGRRGTSPFGNSGTHPGGIRIGGQGGGRSAMQIAGERRFRNYRDDVVLDVRQIRMALKGLRQLTRIGAEDELDLDGTIDSTAKNAGDIELIWQRSRKNAARVLLLMDAGGSMEPHAELCSQLFTAAHSSNHFRDFQYYYFHNCVYHQVYKDIARRDAVSTEHLLKTLDADYKVILVGDAMMGSWELTDPNGAIEYYDHCTIPGMTWLNRINDHFTHCVWMSPFGDERYWINTTCDMVRRVFPMYPLTLDGLNRAVRKLVVKR
jgi:uncharacterized protein